MISRDGDLLSFECDATRCPETLETATWSFAIALERFKTEGWKSEKIGEKFYHYCPDCIDDASKAKAIRMAELAKKMNGE